MVIDSGSVDQSRQIAEAFGADFIPFKWDGKFPKKRNWYLRNHTPKTQWVLFLDADEYLTEDFKQVLRKELPKSEKAGYWLNYTIHFMGKKLRAGYPLDKLALFKTGAGEYERIEENQWSQLDMEIHEHPFINGALGRIKSPINHLDDRGIAHYRAKHQQYARWEAARYLQAKNNYSLRSLWTWKQRIKYALIQTPLLAPLYFMGAFIMMGGFLDGQRGFKFALLKATYFREIRRQIKKAQTNSK